MILYMYSHPVDTDKSPCVMIEPLQCVVRVLNVFLRLLAHVENGTIFAGAQNVLYMDAISIEQAELQVNNVLDATIPDTVGIASIIAKSALGIRTSMTLASGTAHRYVVGSCYIQHHLG